MLSILQKMLSLLFLSIESKPQHGDIIGLLGASGMLTDFFQQLRQNIPDSLIRRQMSLTWYIEEFAKYPPFPAKLYFLSQFGKSMWKKIGATEATPIICHSI